MFITHTKSQTNERQLLTSLLVEYRRPCFYGDINQEMCRKYIIDLIALYDIAWEASGIINANDFDIITQELISDIRYEINNTCKKAGIEYSFLKTNLQIKGCIDKWEAFEASHYPS